eukprot:m.137060 g.137060  ORF g.137060 m.137060 type:complete len:160 (+) comp11232_c0_seq1:199-678(+)
MSQRMHITPIKYKNLYFVITDCPSDETVPKYLEELKKHNVTQLVRVTNPSYNTSSIEAAGINVNDWPFEDGAPPTDEIIQKWLKLCKDTFKKGSKAAIAVHCVAGLGRAPVMVTISLIENGMSPEDAVEYVRKYRKGAINKRQLTFLQRYKKSGKCIIM